MDNQNSAHQGGSTNGGAPPSDDANAKAPNGVGLQGFLRALLRDPVTLVAIGFLVLVLLGSLFAPIVAPYGLNEQFLGNRLQPPLTPGVDGRFPHLLGTDTLGRDVLSRLLHGGRVSISVGLASVVLSGTFGITIGLLAGYFRGWVDDVLSRVVDVMIGFPSLLAAMFILFITGPGFWNVIVVIAVIRWHVYARVTRSLALSYREQPFIEGARVIGLSHARIIRKHIFPNLLSPVLVLATLEIAMAILLEATLSFLGFGIRPPQPSWGIEIAGSREHIRSAWWLVTFSGLIIFVTALSLNLTATWFRTVTDPAQRWTWLRAGSRVSRVGLSGGADDAAGQ